MKAFLLIVAAILLPFATIAAFSAAAILRVRDGAAAGALPTLLTVGGGLLIVALGFCIVALHRMHVAKRAEPDSQG